MKKIAFVFSRPPHGTSLGREGLDAVLSASLVFKKIGLFFFKDGVFQLIKNYHTEKILMRNYVSAFSILSIYNIKAIYCCKSSLIKRGLHRYKNFTLNVDIVDKNIFRDKLNCHDAIINF